MDAGHDSRAVVLSYYLGTFDQIGTANDNTKITVAITQQTVFGIPPLGFLGTIG